MTSLIESKKDEYIRLNERRIDLIDKIARCKDEAKKEKLVKDMKSDDEKMQKISKEIIDLSSKNN